MKKIIILCTTIVISLFAEAQITLGIKAGVTAANQKRIEHEDYYEHSTKAKAAFHFGVFAEKQIINNLYAQPAIQITGKGASHTSSYNDVVTRFRITYLGLPLSVIYKHKVVSGKVYAGIGPVMSFALGGKYSQKGKSRKLFEEGSDWKKSDFGINLLGGFEFNSGLMASVSVQNGFTDIYKHEAAKIRNTTINFSVAYKLYHLR